jgi:Ca-activated chloride channel family protein
MKRGTLSAISATIIAGVVTASGQQPQDGQVFRFRTGVELINVTATVTDRSGRFVPNLRKEDFRVYEDGEEQPVTHFSNERVPVSLGIVLDTSGSMEGEKMTAAKQALNRFLFQLLDRQDEVFLYRFDSHPELVEGWSTDRERIASQLARIRPRGATTLFDAVAEAVPLAQTGRHRKKAVVVISDGNDTSSRTSIREVKQLIRESEVLVYAIGIDGQGTPYTSSPSGPSMPPSGPRLPIPLPFPVPGRRPGRTPPYTPPQPQPGGRNVRGLDERVNVAALRDLTDDSGGRTEIIRFGRDLDPATAGIADELSQQYYLGYPAQGRKDGQWHSIRVEVRNTGQLVRARKGYIATP